MRVLVYERPDSDLIVRALREAALAVDAPTSRRDAHWLAAQNPYDAIVLGTEGDPVAELAPVRAACPLAAVLVLVSNRSPGARAAALDAGADDCMGRPVELPEVVARVRSLIRRKYMTPNPTIKIGDLELETARREVRRAGEPIALTAREYALLEYLAMRAGELVTRAQIWEHVYNFTAEPRSNVIDVYIGTLRKKLEGQGRSRLIHTRRGQGVVLAA